MAEAVAVCLDFYRQALPRGTRIALVGYSMGGVVGLDGATLAVARDRKAWRNRLEAVVTLAAPLHGSSVGQLVNWAWMVTGEPDGLGAAGDDLQARWKDAEEQTRLARRAAFLRSEGARVLTLADPDDSVVRPEEALLPAPGETVADLQVSTRITRPGSLGHGAILDEPAVWRRVLAAVGPQSTGVAAAKDPIEDELQALKARLRREGRLK
jgi:pimeloyl-ACP methyl ester carboxylesterase